MPCRPPIPSDGFSWRNGISVWSISTTPPSLERSGFTMATAVSRQFLPIGSFSLNYLLDPKSDTPPPIGQVRLRQARQPFGAELVEPGGIDCVHDLCMTRSPGDSPPVDNRPSHRQRALRLDRDIDLTAFVQARAQQIRNDRRIVEGPPARTGLGAAVLFKSSQQLGDGRATAIAEGAQRLEARLRAKQLMRDFERDHRDWNAAVEYDCRGMRVDMDVELGRRRHVADLETRPTHHHHFADPGSNLRRLN